MVVDVVAAMRKASGENVSNPGATSGLCCDGRSISIPPGDRCLLVAAADWLFNCVLF